MPTLVGSVWRYLGARRRLEAARRAQNAPAVGPCVRCDHGPGDHHPDGCVIAGCPCLHYAAPAT